MNVNVMILTRQFFTRLSKYPRRRILVEPSLSQMARVQVKRKFKQYANEPMNRPVKSRFTVVSTCRIRSCKNVNLSQAIGKQNIVLFVSSVGDMPKGNYISQNSFLVVKNAECFEYFGKTLAKRLTQCGLSINIYIYVYVMTFCMRTISQLRYHLGDIYALSQ